MKLQRKPVRATGRFGASLLSMLLLGGCAEPSPEPRADAPRVPADSGTVPIPVAETDPAEQQAARAAALLRTRVDSRRYAGPWPQPDGEVAEVELEFFVLPGHSEGDLRLRPRETAAVSRLGSWRIVSGEGEPIAFEVQLQDQDNPIRLRRAQDGALELEVGPEPADQLRLHLVESRDAAEGDAAAGEQLDEVEALDEPEAVGEGADVELTAGPE